MLLRRRTNIRDMLQIRQILSLRNITTLITPKNTLCYNAHLRLSSFSTKNLLACGRYSTKSKNDQDDDEINKPITFSKTKASRWEAALSRTGDVEDRLWYETYVVSLSLAVFLIYFCYLREESDIDQNFDKTLFERVPGLEEQQLRLVLEHHQLEGKSTQEIENRLAEIEESKRKSS